MLVLANKQDLPQAMPVEEVSEKLALKVRRPSSADMWSFTTVVQDIKDKPWYIQGCSAISGDGLSEGLGSWGWRSGGARCVSRAVPTDWLASAVHNKTKGK